MLFLLVSSLLFVALAQPSHLYGIWYCADDGCEWSTEPNLSNAQWMVDRGDGKPTFNVVIFSFLDPLAVMQKGMGAVPSGMTHKAVNFFTSKGIAVLFSIGGEVYSSDGKWSQALANPATLARNAAAISQAFGVGIEIDFEVDSSQYSSALDTFVKTYRSIIPYSSSPKSYLTVDMGAGTGYLTTISKLATQWLNATQIQWANAMVTGSPYGSISEATQYWQQHLTGAGWAGIPPMRPSSLVVSLYSSDGSSNCHNYQGTVLEGGVNWVGQKGSRGIFFWAGGCPSNPSSCISNCQGIQQGSKAILG